ncbi:hypothetical protein ANCCAN_00132 [Ancylostoma caninum]|uniref:Uncharacterized protein n=1 Tax=Ancylostoma caninum TaxID=29170 RepID=A0A368HD71_ANCCA|nr:hypothetical protein ANCCAN_00132 [Ancylostoma caninum]
MGGAASQRVLLKLVAGCSVDRKTKTKPLPRITNICDGLTDCPDGSDEDETMCAFHSIQSEEENRMREKLRKLKEKLNL